MAGKDRCEHDGCIHAARHVLRKNKSRNTLGKDHRCCGKCCPQNERYHR